jgi:N6-L-threonylcarbamoyladenine synthase
MMDPLFLGVDTSNYTTSLALCDAAGQLVADERRVLQVKTGQRGLRQSEALFQHVRNLPLLFESLEEADLHSRLAGIGLSTAPRPAADSYMPVFRAGEGVGRCLAQTLGISPLCLSHQEGHIRSALYGAGVAPDAIAYPMLAIHFSGGTSEILKVEPRDQGFSCEIVGKTLDLNAGQLVDRVGVALGFGFPAGKALEQLARTAVRKDLRFSARVEGCDFHFSGQENQARAALEQGAAPEEVAYGLLLSISSTLERAVRCAAGEYQIRDVLFSGGVMANGLIRERLIKRMEKGPFNLHFTKPEYATDNAAGPALLARDAYIKGQ